MEERAKKILEKHGCEFISMQSECSVLWKNKKGIVRQNDVSVLFFMTDAAWEYWSDN